MNPLARHVLRIGAIAGKEVNHIRRDPRTLALALVAPVLLILVFGYGVSFDVDHVPVAVVDQDGTVASRALVRSLTASGDFVLAARPRSPAEVGPLMASGVVLGAIVIPQGFEHHLGRGEPGEVQWLADGSDANTGNQALLKADAFGRAASARLTHADTSALRPPFSVALWSRFNPAACSALFIVPGLVAYILALVAVLLTALTVAREWERGSMEQLFATPVGTFEIVAGKLLPYLALGILATLLAIGLGVWIFEVPIRGSIALLSVATLVFLVAMLGQGLLVSVVTRNQMVATQAALLSSMMPSVLLSGFMFPIANMPLPLRALANVLPASHFVTVLRGVMLRGNGFRELAPDVLAMVAFAALMVIASTKRFHRSLD